MESLVQRIRKKITPIIRFVTKTAKRAKFLLAGLISRLNLHKAIREQGKRKSSEIHSM